MGRRPIPDTLNILCVTTSYPAGPGDPRGAFVANSVDLLRRAGHKVEVRYCGLDSQHSILEHLRHHPWQIAKLAPRLFGAFRSADHFDRVLCHWAWPLPQLARLRGIPNSTLRVWCHGSGLRLLYQNGLEGLMPQAPTALVAEHQRQFLPERLRAQAWVLPAPLDPSFPSHRGPVEKKLLFVGRLTQTKGADLLPHVLDALPGWQATVVGWGPLAPSLAQDPRIHLLGPLPPLEWAKRVGRGVGLIPSRLPEGAPLVLREFRSLGLPVVTRAIRGLQEPVTDDGLGALVTSDAPELWAEACQHVQGWTPRPWKAGDQASAWLRFVERDQTNSGA